MDVLQKQFSTSYEVTPMLSAALRLQESRKALLLAKECKSRESLAVSEGMPVPCMLELEGLP